MGQEVALAHLAKSRERAQALEAALGALVGAVETLRECGPIVSWWATPHYRAINAAADAAKELLAKGGE